MENAWMKYKAVVSGNLLYSPLGNVSVEYISFHFISFRFISIRFNCELLLWVRFNAHLRVNNNHYNDDDNDDNDNKGNNDGNDN